jgi:hypothetical protein
MVVSIIGLFIIAYLMPQIFNFVYFYVVILFFLFLNIFEEVHGQAVGVPPYKQVNGSVIDSTKLGVIGATVVLTSLKDTLKASTDNQGNYIFQNVKPSVYTISVSSIGYAPSRPLRFKLEETIAIFKINPILLEEEHNLLNEVVINGTPSITYKTDTVEYKASDYTVRQNWTVDELLKKMEGMEVGTNGTLVHQGQPVAKVKVNGKEYVGGDIATAIKNLPAEIIDKIQIVDDYGDEASRTGIKNGDPEKVLNIVTRTDKSVGNMANLKGGAGNDKRYESSTFTTRINGNQSFAINGRLNNTVNGVSGNSSGDDGGGDRNGGSRGAGSGGTLQTSNFGLSYRDQLGKKIQLNLNYGFNKINNNLLNESESKEETTLGTNFSRSFSNSINKTKSHNFRAEIEVRLDSNNYLKITPAFNYNSTLNNRADTVYRTGFIHRDEKRVNSSKSTRPNLSLSAFYQHNFKKSKRNFSAQVSLSEVDQQAEQYQNANILYYRDSTDLVLTDSLINRLAARKNLQKIYRGSMTYVEPLTTNTQLEFNTQINYNGYANNAITSNLDRLGNSQVVDSLSNIFDYSFTQARIAVNYRYGTDRSSKVKFSLGITGVPAVLSGTKVSLNTSTRRSSFNLIPIARFQYLWSKQHSLQLNYNGNAVEPTFDQIQPVRDVSNLNNTIVGNPDLKATFNHNLNLKYNNYISNSKLNYNVGLNSTFTQNAVIRNIIQVLNADSIYNNETRFINTSGVYRVNGNYSINKQLDDRKYNLALSGSFSYNHLVSLSNRIQNIASTWSFQQRFGPRINPTEWFEINPNIAYNTTQSNNSISASSNSRTNTVSLQVDGKIYFLKDYLFGYNARKSYVNGISANVTTNPFVIDLYIQKEFFKRKASLMLQTFDLLNQNNFVNREITDNGYVDTKSNSLSRYLMVKFNVKLQKWSGSKQKGGKERRRSGDGSFQQ